MRAAVIKRDGLVCYLCRRRIIEEHVHIDHVIPVVRGGQTAIDNLAVACAPCNLAKGDKLTSLRPPALVGVDCAAALGPPDAFTIRPRAAIPRSSDVPGDDERLGRWRPRR